MDPATGLKWTPFTLCDPKVAGRLRADKTWLGFTSKSTFSGQSVTMQLYSAYPLARSRQIAADLLGVAVIVIAVLLGTGLAATIATFAEFGRQVEDAGTGLQDSMAGAADTLGGVPLLGEAVAAPFISASEVGTSLADSGREQQRLVDGVALGAGLLVGGVPTLVVAVSRMRAHARFSRRAGIVRRVAESSGGAQLLALRALVDAPLSSVLAAAPDPVTAWRQQDPDAVFALAELETRTAGVRIRR